MYRRRYAKKKLTGVKKALARVYRKKSQHRKAAKVNLSKDMHYFKRHCVLPNIPSDGTTLARFGAWTFKLNDLPNHIEFSTLFDRYMITHVKLRIRIQNDPATQVSSASNYPQLFYVKDFDDSLSPASLNELREHARMKSCMLSPYRERVINIKPSVLTNLNDNVGYVLSPKWKQWIDCASSTVPHYGIKFGIDNLLNANYNVLIRATYYFRCKDTR